MKPLKITKVAFLILCFSTLLSLAHAQQQIRSGGDSGGQESHGGDHDQAEFISLARRAVVHIQRLQSQFPEINAEILSSTIERGSAPIPVEGPIRCGAIEGAAACYNSARQEIIFDRGQWRQLAASPSQREALIRIALHEFLRRAGANDDSYQISDRFLRVVSPAQFASDFPQRCSRETPSCTFERTFVGAIESEGMSYNLGIDALVGQTIVVSAEGWVTCSILGRQTQSPLVAINRGPMFFATPLFGLYSGPEFTSVRLDAIHPTMLYLPGFVSNRTLSMNLSETCGIDRIVGPYNFRVRVVIYNGSATH